MPATLPLKATQLSFGYADLEDRLVLTASDATDAAVTVLLTRRLTGRLINGLASIVERSSAMASRAPQELRDDVILLERQGALSSGVGHGQGTVGAEPAPQLKAAQAESRRAARLLQAIDIATTSQAFELTLRDRRGPLISLALDRAALHRVIERLGRQAEAAHWNLTIEAAWLEPGPGAVVLN